MLGPVEVVRDGAVVALTRQERVFIAALASRAPEPVSFGLLEDALWRDGAPRRPDKALQSLVLRIRRSLGAGAIATRGDGYALGPGVTVDVKAFEARIAERGSTEDRVVSLAHRGSTIGVAPPTKTSMDGSQPSMRRCGSTSCDATRRGARRGTPPATASVLR